jgi:hypothetical protein
MTLKTMAIFNTNGKNGFWLYWRKKVKLGIWGQSEEEKEQMTQ